MIGTLDIIHDIGVNENTISTLATRIALNADRPAANQKSADEMGEKLRLQLLEALQ